MAHAPSTARVIRINEQGLRRFAQRQADPSFVFDGTRVRIRLEQPLFPEAPGEEAPMAFAILEGRREFGGSVVFEHPPRVQVEGATEAEDIQSLHAVAEEFLEVFLQLCRCGQFPEACDCCKSCRSSGHVWNASKESSMRCPTCHGRGYLGSDDLAAND